MRAVLRPALPLLLLALAWSPAALADDRDDARRHFKAALDAAALDDFRTAVDEFLLAYEAIEHPTTAFNIARAYEDLGELAEAVRWYETYLTFDPERPELAEEPLARLRPQLAAPAEAVPLDDPEAVRERLAALEAERARLLDQLGEAVPADAPPSEDPAADPAPEDPAPEDPAVTAPDATTAPAPTPPARPEGVFLSDDPYARAIVTASRYSQDPLDAPTSVTVLDGEALRDTGAVTLQDALRRVVGVDVISPTAGVPYLGVRAFNTSLTNKVLWLIDGRPANIEYLGTPLEVSLQVQLDEIDRIEIIRGPGSAVYGANAVTGVINIITRLPGEGPRAVAAASGGFPRFGRASAVATGATGPYSYRVSAGFQELARYEKDLDELDPEGVIDGFRRNQDVGSRRVQAAGRFDARFLDKGWVSVSGGYGQGFTEYLSKAALGRFGLEGQLGHVRADLAYGPFHLRTYYDRIDGRTAPWLYSLGALRSQEAFVRSDVVDVEAEGTFEAATGEVRHNVHVGAGYTYKLFRAGQIGEGLDLPRREDHAKGFVQYQLRWRILGATASLRVDRHPLLRIQDTISPRGAVSVRVAKDTALRASAGTAFRALNALESYVNLALNTSADGYFVNFTGAFTDPDGVQMRPERITSAELGVRDESSSIHELDAAVYWNRVTDLVDIGSVEPSLGTVNTGNNGYSFGRAGWINRSGVVYDNVGGEVDLTLFPVDGLDVFGNVSISTVVGRDSVTRDTLFTDRSTALVHANLGATYRAPFRMRFSATGHYVSGQQERIFDFDDRGSTFTRVEPVRGRLLLVSRIAGVVVQDPEIELSATVWNPVGFVDRWPEHPGGQAVGPRVFGTVKASF